MIHFFVEALLIPQWMPRYGWWNAVKSLTTANALLPFMMKRWIYLPLLISWGDLICQHRYRFILITNLDWVFFKLSWWCKWGILFSFVVMVFIIFRKKGFQVLCKWKTISYQLAVDGVFFSCLTFTFIRIVNILHEW